MAYSHARRSGRIGHDLHSHNAMRRGEVELLAQIRALRADMAEGFRAVAGEFRTVNERLGRIETNLVNLAADFRLHVNDGHAHGDEP